MNASDKRGRIYATLATAYAELAELEGVPVAIAAQAPANGDGVPAAAPRRPATMLSKAELGAALHRSPATIDRWSASGMPHQEMGSYRLFDLAACQAWAASRPKPGRPARKAPPVDAAAPAEYTIRTRTPKSA